MTRVTDIADYLLSTGISDTEAAWKAEVLKTIAARWPDVSREDLTAAYLLATVQTATQVLDAMSAPLEHPASQPTTGLGCEPNQGIARFGSL